MPCNDVVSPRFRLVTRPLLPVAAALGLLAIFFNPPLSAAIIVPDPGKHVVDNAKIILLADEQQMEGWLKELEQKTTAQVKVLTVATTGDEDIFTFSQRQYRLWKLGTKQKGNGALIVLPVQNRQVRVHTGYGLEGVLPDIWCSHAEREAIDGFFKVGKYSEGLKQLTLAVVQRVAADAGVQISGLQTVQPAIGQHKPAKDELFWTLLPVVAVIVIVIIFMAISSTRRGRKMWGSFGPTVYTGGGWGYGGSGWSSSGGFSGSSGGSFGGGGSSGGGGATGSW